VKTTIDEPWLYFGDFPNATFRNLKLKWLHLYCTYFYFFMEPGGNVNYGSAEVNNTNLVAQVYSTTFAIFWLKIIYTGCKKAFIIIILHT
jgi:hypothetical protein